MEKFMAMAVPILPGKTEQLRKFINELNNDRNKDFVASRKKLNVHERTFLQQTPMGDMVIVTLEGPDPERAFKDFSSGNDEFTNWFVKQVKEIHGIDLNDPPPAFPELLIDSKERVLQES